MSLFYYALISKYKFYELLVIGIYVSKIGFLREMPADETNGVLSCAFLPTTEGLQKQEEVPSAWFTISCSVFSEPLS